MSIGPGKCDAACTQARIATKARTAILIVLGGESGSGMSVQSVDPDITAQIPMILMRTAQMIEEDLITGKN
jgi:dissimilatory sulfite reductase (desulfoviridin) alpha/beta subunit